MARKKHLKLTWREVWPVWLTMGILAALGAGGLWLYTPARSRPTIQVATEDVSLSIATLDADRAQLFSYPLSNATKVQFFMRKLSGTRLQVAFASCRRCYRSGSFPLDSQMICGRCNEAMEVAGQSETPAPDSDCRPIAIPYEEANGRVVVRGQVVRDLFDRWYRPALAGLERYR